MRLGCPSKFITKILSDVRRKHYNNQNTNSNDPQPPTISLPRNDFSEKLVKLMLKAHGIRVVHKATNTLGSSLFKRNCSTTANSSPQIGVYRIKCQDCDSVYFGETGRVLSKRIGEHRSDLNNMRANSKSALVTHKRRLRHEPDLGSARIIFPSRSWRKRNIVESALIKHKHNNMNIDRGKFKNLGTFISHVLVEWNEILVKNLSRWPG